MCFDIQTSITSFISVTITGIIALKINQPIIGCLMISYGFMQLSEIFIWRGIDNNNTSLNRIGTTIGKYTLPTHNIALGIGVLIAFWYVRNRPKYWIPLIVGIVFYIGVMFNYYTEKDDNDGITNACKYPQDKDRCTKSSARLEWPYPHSWYIYSVIISLIIVLIFLRPVPISIIVACFYSFTFLGTLWLGKHQVLGSYWCWSTAALAPILLIVVYFLQKSQKQI